MQGHIAEALWTCFKDFGSNTFRSWLIVSTRTVPLSTTISPLNNVKKPSKIWKNCQGMLWFTSTVDIGHYIDDVNRCNQLLPFLQPINHSTIWRALLFMQVVNVDLSIRPVSYAVRLEGTDHDRDTESPRLQPRTSRAQPVNVSLKQTTPNMFDALLIEGFHVGECYCWILSDLHRAESCTDLSCGCYKICLDEWYVESSCVWRASGSHSSPILQVIFWVVIHHGQGSACTCEHCFASTTSESAYLPCYSLCDLLICSDVFPIGQASCTGLESRPLRQQFLYIFQAEQAVWVAL